MLATDPILNITKIYSLQTRGGPYMRCRTIFVQTNDPGPWEFRLDEGRAGYWNGKPPFGVPEGRDSVPDRLHGDADSPSSETRTTSTTRTGSPRRRAVRACGSLG